ncbi:MAG TPA: methyltransferase domain-containing protein [Bacteroidota bacterium]|nr:methyltransferase domain-containing protein [Bacteroidota bacterium]
MSCNCANGAALKFTKAAAHYERRYRRRGLDTAQKHLVRGLKAQGIEGLSLFDIGSGVGALDLELLKAGAASARVMDAAPGMIESARRLANKMALSEKMDFRAEEFLSVADVQPEADIVLLDKVLCCLENPKKMIGASASKARRLYAVSFPRDSFIAKIVFKGTALLGRLLRWSFYPSYHEPSALAGWIKDEGFSEAYSGRTVIWQILVYRRENGRDIPAGNHSKEAIHR